LTDFHNFLCTTSQANAKVIGVKICHHTFVMLLPYRVKISDTVTVWTYLQRKTNMNSYTVYRMVPFPMILNHTCGCQGHDILKLK